MRKVPKRLGGGGEHHDMDHKAFHRRRFYEILDLLDAQLAERFSQPVEKVLEETAARYRVFLSDIFKET